VLGTSLSFATVRATALALPHLDVQEHWVWSPVSRLSHLSDTGVVQTHADLASVAFVGDVAASLGMGLLIGALLGLVLARPAMWLAEKTRSGSLESMGGRALFGIGTWMLVPPFVGAVFMACAATFRSFHYFLEDGSLTKIIVGLAILPPIAIVAMLAGTGLLAYRKRWLAAVKKGDVPRYRVRPVMESDATLPALEAQGSDEEEAAVLEEVVTYADVDPYRAADLKKPLARIHR
jgi:hypothetical protein